MVYQRLSFRDIHSAITLLSKSLRERLRTNKVYEIYIIIVQKVRLKIICRGYLLESLPRYPQHMILRRKS